MAAGRPTLHILAGPNGAGKTTLYETRVRQLTAGAEFVNADLLALERFGHPAATFEESAEGQRLAEERREALISSGRSLVAESTFSHRSKLDLLRRAKAAGFRVVVYHVSVDGADLAVERVRARVKEGGHPVPETKVRERYARNQALIRQAVREADQAFIFDNSALERSHVRVLTFKNGQVMDRVHELPRWAVAIYGQDLQPQDAGST